ncbi:MAG: hypothetical protein V1711_01700 [bacterium]
MKSPEQGPHIESGHNKELLDIAEQVEKKEKPEFLFHGTNAMNIEKFEPRKRQIPSEAVGDVPARVYGGDNPAFASAFAFPWSSNEGFKLSCDEAGKVLFQVPEKLKDRLNQKVFLYKFSANQFELTPGEGTGHSYHTEREVTPVGCQAFETVQEAIEYFGGTVEFYKNEELPQQNRTEHTGALTREHKPHSPISTSESEFTQRLDELNAKLEDLFIEAVISQEEIVSQNRNFEIECQIGEKEANVLLKHKESGKVIDIGKFLPPNFLLKAGDEFACGRIKGENNKDSGSVIFLENSMRFRGSILTLFHEIGHSRQGKRELKITRWDEIKVIVQAIHRLLKSFSIKKEFAQNENGKKTITFTLTSLKADQVIPQRYLDQTSRTAIDAKRERDAWAFALKSLRKLEREGYNVFDGFENAEEIKRFIAINLATYDWKLIKDKLSKGDIESAAKGEDTTPFSRAIRHQKNRPVETT